MNEATAVFTAATNADSDIYNNTSLKKMKLIMSVVGVHIMSVVRVVKILSAATISQKRKISDILSN